MQFRIQLALATAYATYLAGQVADAKAVFCHYMIGTVTPGSGHAELDIDQAIAIGFDAFALNVGNPNADWARSTVSQLFNYATGKNIKLFFSVDLFADGNPSDHVALIQQYINHSAYYRYNNRPFLSTFGGGALGTGAISNFKNSIGSSVYFVPDFDGVNNFYNDPTGWLSAWGGLVDGAFGWETAWPGQQDSPAQTSTVQDEWVTKNILPAGKNYMVSLSSLQYKHYQGTHYYRVGEVNLPQRMQEILNMPQVPEFAELITWNDAGESHYIGNLWSEGIPQDILNYANQGTWDHSGWQSLAASFIAAFKSGGKDTSMVPHNGKVAAGSIWYHTIFKGATCGGDPYGKPGGWGAALDAINVGIVVAGSGYSVRFTSGGAVIKTMALSPGLNYASIPGLRTGGQKAELLGSNGSVVLTATGRVDVAADTGGICNFNYQVAAFS